MKHRSTLILAAAALSSVGVGMQALWAQSPAGTLRAWGSNVTGQLGDGTTNHRSLPAEVAGLGTVVSASVGNTHAIAAKADGTVWAWGDNNFGQLGNGTYTSGTVPVQVTGLTGVTRVAAGLVFSMALKSDGTVWAWGLNQNGELGNGTRISSPIPVQVCCLLNNVVEIAAGGQHGLAMKSDGTVWAWGYNDFGQLGLGNSGPGTDLGVASMVTNGFNAAHIAASGFHSSMAKRDGTVWSWGNNWYGQLGDGSTTHRSVPVPAAGLSNIVDIATGALHSLAVKSDGTVWAWGNGVAGSLGDGEAVSSSIPLQVPNMNSVSAVACGFGHSMAVKSDGTAWSWGLNDRGQLGNGTTVNDFVPTIVNGLAGVVALAKVSETSSMAISRQVEFATAEAKLTITSGSRNGFTLTETATLGSTSNGINPLTEVFVLHIGPYSAVIPVGSFKSSPGSRFAYNGTVDGVKLDVQINPSGTNGFTVKASGSGVSLGGLTNPVPVRLTIGNDLGTVSATANFN